MSVIRVAFQLAADFLDRLFWDFRGSIHSYDSYKLLQKIYSRKDNEEQYLKAIDNLNAGSKEETFVLHDGDQVTLTRS